MRVAINASFLRKQSTGIGQVTTNFLNELVDFSFSDQNCKKEEIEFVLYLEEDIDLKLSENFSKRIFLPLWKRDDLIRKIWWETFSLPKKIKKDKCDILLSLYQSPTVIKSRSIKHIMLVHDIIPKLFPQYLNNWRKKIYQAASERGIKKADKIITVSHRSEKDLIEHLEIDPKKISVVYVDADPIYKTLVEKEKSKEILQKYSLKRGYIYTGGGLEMRKNTESVLRAYKILLEAYGHASWLPRLVVSGKLLPQLAPLVLDVESVVKGLEIENEVTILGFVEQEDLPALYANASLFIYPSLYEGFGLPVLEAMCQSVPVITSKKSSLPEVGADSVLYCDPNDVDDLAMVMKNVLTNDHLRTALSLKGKERSTHFSWNKFASKLMNIIYERNY